PATHSFEQWGDGRTYDGTLTIQQPLIQPLHGGKSELELLAMLLGDGPQRGDEIVRATFDELAGGNEQAWKKALHDGFVADTAAQPVEASPSDAEAGDEARPSLGEGELELVFCESEHVYDGRYANNGWLQEVPSFLSKITWDNAALISVPDAERLGVKNNEVVRLTLGDRSIELPVYVMPGQAVGSIGVELGYGRTAAGLVGGFDGGDESLRVASVGDNAYTLRTSDALEF